MTNIYQGGPGSSPASGPGSSPGGSSGSSPASSPGSGSGSGLRRGRRWRRWAAVLAVTAVVVGGGAFAAAEAATGSPAAPAALTAAASQGSATSQAAQAKKDAARHRRLARLRRIGGMYGSDTFDTKQGARTVAFERGTIVSVAGNDVMVRAKNGTTWQWTLTGTSVVREDGKRTTDTALKSGEPVFTAGPVTGSARDVRLIVIRKAAASAGQPTT